MVKKIKKVKERKLSLNSLLTRMNLRAIIRSKLQFIAVIFITAIAMCLYVGLTSNAKSINERVNALYEQSNIADIWTTTAMAAPEDQHQIEKIVGPKGKTEGRFIMPAKLRTYEATALMSEELPTINKPAKTDNSEDKNFFIIDERLLDRDITGSNPFTDENGNYLTAPVHFSITGYQKMLASAKIGNFDGKDYTLMDALKFCQIDENNDLLTNPYLTLDIQITGRMSFAENVQSSQMNNTNFLLSVSLFRSKVANLIYSTFALPEEPETTDPDYEIKTFLRGSNFINNAVLMVHSLTSNNQFVSLVDPNYDVHQVKQNIQEYYNKKGQSNNLLMVTELDMLMSNFNVQSDITQARQLAYIFPIIFFLVAILVVLTTISQIIIKDRIAIGTFKGLGLSNLKIVMHYMALGVYIVLIGVALGAIIGPFIIPMIMNQKYDILYNLPPMSFTIAIPEAVISTLIVMAVTCLVTLLVVKNTVKLKPAESMRPKEVKMVKASRHQGKITKTSIPIRMAFRNIRLNLAKSLMVIVGIAGCTSLLVCGFGIDDTLDHGVESDSNNFLSADMYASYNSNNSIKDELLSVDGVKYVEEYTNLPTTAMCNDFSYQTLLFVFDDNSQFFGNKTFEFTDKLIVSGKIANAMNLKVGDKVSFSSVGMNFEGEVGYILDVFYMHGIYANAKYNNLSQITDIRTHAWIDIVEGANEIEVMEKLNEVGGVSNVKSRQENIDLVNSYMSSISLMTLAVKVFAILLAIVVLYNLSLLNFKERTRDIATLKVLGFSKLEISISLIIESMVLTLLGVGVGLLLGLPMEILVLMVNLTPLVEFLYIVYPLSYVISFILTIGTTALVNYLLTFKINKVQMVESLKSVE